MKARDVMTTDVVSVRADTRTREVARLLLARRISAVPVVDADGAPIGMVSEGDLIGRDDAARAQRRDWWLALLSEGEALGPAFLANLGRNDRTALAVMSSPVVTVDEDTDTAEIARLLQAYRIKRVPVLRHGRMVGIVSRENLLRVLAEVPPVAAKPPALLAGVAATLDRAFEHAHAAGAAPAATSTPASPSEAAAPTAETFRQLVADHESREAAQRVAEHRREAEARAQRVAGLIDDHISDLAWRALVHQARRAAETGAEEFLLLRFPSTLCRDGGRAVNVAEPDWPATLRGEPAELYLRWEQDLKPHGFRLVPRVLAFPGGMPGDIGLYLAWGR